MYIYAFKNEILYIYIYIEREREREICGGVNLHPPKNIKV